MQELPTIQPTLAPELSPEEIAAISEEVRALAEQRNAVVLAHNYQLPEIQDVAHYLGDSLGLSRQAAATDAETIAFCGVHFMAETASILSPQKTVLIPDLDAGCSLADSITAEQLRAWKAQHPSALVVMYVNTSAEVKAESDICCTSANAVAIVESLGVDRVIFLPDEYLGKYVASQTNVEIILWKGHCEVHERFTGKELRRHRDPGPSRVPAGRAGRGRLRGLHGGHGPPRGRGAAEAGGDDHRVLHERQRRRRVPGRRVHPPLQPLPAHEADHAAEDPALAADDGV
jgi:quinolinate synthase